jgi:hypothetical protein
MKETLVSCALHAVCIETIIIIITLFIFCQSIISHSIQFTHFIVIHSGSTLTTGAVLLIVAGIALSILFFVWWFKRVCMSESDRNDEARTPLSINRNV